MSQSLLNLHSYLRLKAMERRKNDLQAEHLQMYRFKIDWLVLNPKSKSFAYEMIP